MWQHIGRGLASYFTQGTQDFENRAPTSARRSQHRLTKPALALAGLGLALAGTTPAAALSYSVPFEESGAFGYCTVKVYYDREVSDGTVEQYSVVITRFVDAEDYLIGNAGGSYLDVIDGEHTVESTQSPEDAVLDMACGISNAVITKNIGIGDDYETADYYGIEFTGTFEGQPMIFKAYMDDAGGHISAELYVPPPSGPDVAAIVDAIAQSQRHNAARLLQAQPDLARIVFSGLGTGPDLWLTPGSAGISQDGQFWFKLSSTFDLEGDTEPYLFGVVGGHLMPTNDLALGAMFEFDSSATDQIETSGWLIGPYLVARMPGSSIVAEARLLYGDTVSTGDVLGLENGELGGDRLLAHLALSGRIEAGIVVFTPRLEGSYVLARSDAYVTDDETEVPSVETGLAKLKASLDGDIDLIHIGLAGVTLGGGVSGNWSHAQSDGGFEAEDFTFGSALRLGFVPSEALRISLGLDLDGIGTDATTARISGGLNGAF